MLTDLHRVEDGQDFDADICIVGAGIAGIVAARRLEAAGHEPPRAEISGAPMRRSLVTIDDVDMRYGGPDAAPVTVRPAGGAGHRPGHAPLPAAGQARVVAVSSWFASIKECGQRALNFGYSGSKALMNCYFRLAANAMRESGVVVFMVNPGWMRTRMGGERAERDPAQSARDILDLAARADDSLRGRFVDTDGSDHPW